MSKPLTLDAFRKALQERLEELYLDREERANQIDPTYGVLITELKSLILRGGKRLRPYLTYLTYIGLGGTNEEAIIDLAASQELLHNFLIIHDDVFDHDVMRYGGLNVSGRYRLTLPKRMTPTTRNHLANTLAIMGGDITLGFGISQIVEADFPPELRLKAMRRLEQMIFEVGGGETLDVLIPTFDLPEVSEGRLLQTYRYKTASYSFEGPMQLGAIMAEANDATMTSIKEVAIPLGVAFQLADDLLGVYGNESELGKSVLSDLREGKRTLLMIKAMDLCDTTNRKVLESILGNHKAGYSDLGKVRAILDDCGARRYVEKLANVKVEEALRLIPSIGLSREVEVELRRLAALSISRQT